ncbi:hypothetical protein P3L10_010959 [Capsicum annuum]
MGNSKNPSYLRYFTLDWMTIELNLMISSPHCLHFFFNLIERSEPFSDLYFFSSINPAELVFPVMNSKFKYIFWELLKALRSHYNPRTPIKRGSVEEKRVLFGGITLFSH